MSYEVTFETVTSSRSSTAYTRVHLPASRTRTATCCIRLAGRASLHRLLILSRMLTRMDMRHCAKHLGFLTDSSFLFCGLFHQFGHNIIVSDLTTSSEIDPESSHEFADQGNF
ncbi:hypothetical protein F2Q68_00032046 [Brassica cretica]|uniref:Uncharacterized protein n=1 Tax=Brassica cretica TaxID=69181 RepID=A0A8S9G9T8_BRACR|nr:hypothetical protein F2Q68_00032046 [Brassica cretica]